MQRFQWRDLTHGTDTFEFVRLTGIKTSDDVKFVITGFAQGYKNLNPEVSQAEVQEFMISHLLENAAELEISVKESQDASH